MATKISVIVLLLTVMSLTPELNTVRIMYQEAQDNAEATEKMYETLLTISKEDAATLVAFKGAASTLKSKFAERLKDKKNFFKDGKALLEHAIAIEPKNVEIRCIRLSVQENVPKITGYKKNISEDKNFILDHYIGMTDPGAKDFVKGYILQSASFTTAEKQLF